MNDALATTGMLVQWEELVPKHSSRLKACLETLEALIRSGVPDAIYLAEKASDAFVESEPDISRRIDALHALRDGLEDMAVSGARLDTANAILAHVTEKLREWQRDD
jgi:hypothetical protein